MKSKKKTQKDYNNAFKQIMKQSIDDFVKNYPNKLIIFVGSLDNFAPIGMIYKIKADHKILLDVPLPEIMKRYYLRVCKTNAEITKTQSKDYWMNLSKGVYNIKSTKNIIEEYKKYMHWHKQNNYKNINDKNIIIKIKKLII
jgi:hypothetical protein